MKKSVLLVFGLFILFGFMGVVSAEIKVLGSSDFGGEYILSEGEDNYVLYVNPSIPSVDPAEVFITAGFQDLSKNGGANRVRSWSSNPDNKFPTVFTLYALTGAYKIGEIPLGNLNLYNHIYVRLDYGEEFAEWTIPIEEISVGVNNELESPEEENLEIIEPDEEKPADIPQEEEKKFFCNGCELEDKCYPFGYRKNKQFCSDVGSFTNQIGGGEFCENNFECRSNLCIDDVCTSPGFFKKIIDWFRRLFGSD